MNSESITKEKKWTPETWKSFPIKQLPTYPDEEALMEAYDQLKTLPPLITSWEVNALKRKLANVQAGEGFLLQGGDCAESFDDCRSPKIVNLLKVLMQMSFIMTHEMGIPVVQLGRIAGQYAKPRSRNYEHVDGKKIQNYRGDLINRIKPTKEARIPDPNRLIEGYEKAALTINFLRALADEGFADLHHPEYWELDFMQQNEYYSEYKVMVQSIQKAVGFMDTLAPNQFKTIKQVDFYTSHEALNLYYDSAQTRQVPRRTGWFNMSAHLVWLGNRTRNINEAHVEYLRGIQNPIGIKIGPGVDIDETVQLIEKLNPEREAGKIVLISRMGEEVVKDKLPPFIREVEDKELPVLWCSDPMHGNTFSTDDGVKTRNFDAILNEIKSTFAIHNELGTYLGGVHLELTGDNVTECVGGANNLDEDGLRDNYASYCDPRLNYQQSLELAFLIAKEWKKGEDK